MAETNQVLFSRAEFLALAGRAGFEVGEDDLDQLLRRNLLRAWEPRGSRTPQAHFHSLHLFMLARYVDSVRTTRHPWGAVGSEVGLPEVAQLARECRDLVGFVAENSPDAAALAPAKAQNLLAQWAGALRDWAGRINPFGPLDAVAPLLGAQARDSLRGDGLLYLVFVELADAFEAKIDADVVPSKSAVSAPVLPKNELADDEAKGGESAADPAVDAGSIEVNSAVHDVRQTVEQDAVSREDLDQLVAQELSEVSWSEDEVTAFESEQPQPAIERELAADRTPEREVSEAKTGDSNQFERDKFQATSRSENLQSRLARLRNEDGSGADDSSTSTLLDDSNEDVEAAAEQDASQEVPIEEFELEEIVDAPDAPEDEAIEQAVRPQKQEGAPAADLFVELASSDDPVEKEGGDKGGGIDDDAFGYDVGPTQILNTDEVAGNPFTEESRVDGLENIFDEALEAPDFLESSAAVDEQEGDEIVELKELDREDAADKIDGSDHSDDTENLDDSNDLDQTEAQDVPATPSSTEMADEPIGADDAQSGDAVDASDPPDEREQLRARTERLNRLRQTYLAEQRWEELGALYEDGLDLFGDPVELQRVLLTLALLYELKLDRPEVAFERFEQAYRVDGDSQGVKKAFDGMQKLGAQDVLQSRWVEFLESELGRDELSAAARVELQRHLALGLYAMGAGQRAFFTYTAFLADARPEQLDERALDDLETLAVGVADEELGDIYADLLAHSLPDDVFEPMALRAARHHADGGEVGLAMEYYERVLARFPRHEVAFHSLGQLYEDAARWVPLRALYEARIDLSGEESSSALRSELARIDQLMSTSVTSD